MSQKSAKKGFVSGAVGGATSLALGGVGDKVLKLSQKAKLGYSGIKGVASNYLGAKVTGDGLSGKEIASGLVQGIFGFKYEGLTQGIKDDNPLINSVINHMASGVGTVFDFTIGFVGGLN